MACDGPNRWVDPAVGPNPRTPAPETPTPAPTAPTAAAFDYAGTWAGAVDQPGAQAYSISMGLLPDPANGYLGLVEYPELSCKGELTTIELTTEHLLLREQITEGSCIATGEMVLAPQLDGSIAWSYSSDLGGSASATIWRT